MNTTKYFMSNCKFTLYLYITINKKREQEGFNAKEMIKLYFLKIIIHTDHLITKEGMHSNHQYHHNRAILLPGRKTHRLPNPHMRLGIQKPVKLM